MKFALDNSIMVKGKIAASGSRILSNFHAPFSATAYSKLKNAGMEYYGYTRPDEFGVAPLFCDKPGEIAEAVRCVADGRCDVALGNDVFGKLRRQAPENGLFYIHPTYGTVSRFGLIPAISSMDQIGLVCRSLDDGFAALSIIAGHDKNDATTYPQADYSYSPQPGNLRIAVPDNVMQLADEKSRQAILAFTGVFESESFELKYFNALHQVQYILGCAEICNNTNRYDGIKFGYRTSEFSGLNELYSKTRAEGFGPDMKLASIMGCMVLSREHYDSLYLKAMKIRRLVKQQCDELFSRYDAIALPTSIEDRDEYEQSALYALATLAGLPSVSIPCMKDDTRCGVQDGGPGGRSSIQYGAQDGGRNVLNGGIQLIAQSKNEGALLSVCRGGL